MSRSITISPVEGGASLMIAWRLEGRRVLVIGGGAVAAGRVRLALEANAKVTVVAPELGVELRHRLSVDGFDYVARPFELADLDDADMVLVAADDPALGPEVAVEARRRRIPVNVADVPERCDFWFSSVFRDGPLQVAVSTAGQGPSLGARLVREIGASIPRQVAQGLSRFGALRARIRALDPAADSSPRRMRYLAEIGRTWAYERLAALDDGAIEEVVAAYQAGRASPAAETQDHPFRDAAPRAVLPTTSTASQEAARPSASQEVASLGVTRPPEVTCHDPAYHPKRGVVRAGVRHPSGKIRLVGAGPGDPDLLTVGAKRALEEADLVIADLLIAPEILSLVRGELRVAKKTPGRSAEAQREIEAWAIEAAHAGLCVVRLKQGDPFIYGRASEELDAFRGAGITTETIAGISSVTAAPLVAGIPLTHRDLADRFTVLTGQGANGRSVDLPSYDPKSTLVLLMAVARAEEIGAGLIGHGHPGETPVAVIERATQPDQRVTRTTLWALGSTIMSARIESPAVIVIGRVASLGAEAGGAAASSASGPSASAHRREAAA